MENDGHGVDNDGVSAQTFDVTEARCSTQTVSVVVTHLPWDIHLVGVVML